MSRRKFEIGDRVFVRALTRRIVHTVVGFTPDGQYIIETPEFGSRRWPYTARELDHADSLLERIARAADDDKKPSGP